MQIASFLDFGILAYMYKVYTTKGIILSARSQKEADRIYVVFTEKIGLVRVYARSIRKESSKNRYGAQLFSEVTISLISGKGGWMIVGIKNAKNKSEKSTHSKIGSLARVARILSQSLAYENPDRELYQIVSFSWRDLHSEEDFQNLARSILFHLGLADPSEKDFETTMIQARISLGYSWSF